MNGHLSLHTHAYACEKYFICDDGKVVCFGLFLFGLPSQARRDYELPAYNMYVVFCCLRQSKANGGNKAEKKQIPFPRVHLHLSRREELARSEIN